MRAVFSFQTENKKNIFLEKSKTLLIKVFLLSVKRAAVFLFFDSNDSELQAEAEISRLDVQLFIKAEQTWMRTDVFLQQKHKIVYM